MAAFSFTYAKITYHIVQIFDGGKFDVFDALQLDRQNLTCQIVLKQYNIYRCMVKDSNHPSKCFLSNTIFEESVFCKISPRQNLALYGIQFIKINVFIIFT